MNLKLSNFQKQILCAIVIFLAASVSHLRALRNDYVIDDYKIIVYNEFISDWNNAKVLLNPKYLIDPYPLKCGARPVMLLSLIIDQKIWGQSPFGYHFTNILLHGMSSACIFMLTFLLLKYGKMKEDVLDARPDYEDYAVSMFASLVFAFHPIQAEAVNVASFRADLLATFFYLAALILIIRAVHSEKNKNLKYYISGFVLFVMGMFSKEMVITLALVFPFYVYIIVGRKIRKRTFVVAAACIAAAVIFILFFWNQRFFYLLHHSVFPNIEGNLSPVSSISAYLNTIFLSILHYAETIILPFGLAVDYELPVRASVLNPGMFMSLVATAVIAGAAYLVKDKVFRFGLVFMLLAYLPVSNIFPLINTVNDRYMYLPMAGFSIAFAVLIFKLSAKIDIKGISAGLIIAVMLSSLYLYATLERNLVFADGFSLYSDAVKTASNNIRVRYNLGVAHMIKGDYVKALENFAVVSNVNPVYKRADLLHLEGVCYQNLGDSRKAEKHFVRSLHLRPNKETILRYANMLMQEGDQDGAVSLLKKSIDLGPDPLSYNNIGIYYAVRKDYNKAADYFAKAIELDPEYANAWANLVKTAQDSGNTRLSDQTVLLLRKYYPHGSSQLGANK